MSLSSEFANPPLVPGYEIIGSIGQGAMGTVYEAIQDGQLVALKVLLPFEEGNEMALERFRREVNVASQIGHPGVPRVFDAGQLRDGRFFYAMERLHGDDLENWRLAPKRTRLEAIDVIAASLEPLAAAHDVAIVHRDLKPENIFVEESGAVRLLDFGVARHLDGESKLRTSTGIAVGTPVYMSPEQATAPSAVGPASDVWSVGIMLYESITGRLPFDGESLHGVILAACTKEPVSLLELAPEVDPRLSELVHRCLEKAPSDRPKDARELANELTGLLTTKPVRDSLGAPIEITEKEPQPTSGELFLPPALAQIDDARPAIAFADETARPAVSSERSPKRYAAWLAAAATLLASVGGGVWLAREAGPDDPASESAERPASGAMAASEGTATQGTASEGTATQGTASEGTATQGTASEGTDTDLGAALEVAEAEPAQEEEEPEPELASAIMAARPRVRASSPDRALARANVDEPNEVVAAPSVAPSVVAERTSPTNADRPNPEDLPAQPSMVLAPPTRPEPDPVPRPVSMSTVTMSTVTMSTVTMSTVTMSTVTMRTPPRETPPAERPGFVTF